MEDKSVSFTRSPDQDRGMFGRGDMMAEARRRFEEARNEGQKKDGEAIHNASQKGVERVVKAVEWVGGKVEGALKFGDRILRGAEANVKKVAENSWEVIKGLGEDTQDVIANTAKATLTGVKWVGIGTAAAAAAIGATPIVIADTVAMGMVELTQHGAKKVSELRARVNGSILHGVHALAAAIEAKALAGQAYEADRIVNVRDQHADRVRQIRDKNLGVLAVRAAKDFIGNK